MAKVGRFSANAKNASNSFVGRKKNVKMLILEGIANFTSRAQWTETAERSIYRKGEMEHRSQFS